MKPRPNTSHSPAGRRALAGLALCALLLLQCGAAPAAAYRSRHRARMSEQQQQQQQQQTAATRATSASSTTPGSSSHPPPPDRVMHTPFNSEASLQLAARQRLFDYAVQQGLDILDAVAKHITIPEYKTTIEVPIIGGIDVSVSAINITNLSVPREAAKVAIEAGYYHLRAANLTAQITFDWAWSKGPLSGSGYGNLSLDGGSLDEIFLVRNQEAGVPQLVAVSSAVGFVSLDLTIHSFSADWLYQALMFIFSGTIQRQIEEAIDSAVHTDVPSAINGLLDSLPSRLSVQGLPFDAVFTYAVYTLNYVIVKGYGEVDVGPEPPTPSSSSSSNGSLAAGHQQQLQLQQQQQQGEASDPLLAAATSAGHQAAAAAPAAVPAAGTHHHHQQQQQPAVAAAAAAAAGGKQQAAPGPAPAGMKADLLQGACPFPASPLPFTPAEIGGDASMFTTYLHEAIPNCILWGLFRSGALVTTVQDGSIPQLRLITDLFGGLIPELPKVYPKKGMLLDIAASEPPQVRFRSGAGGGVLVSASYDTNVSVLDAAGDGQPLLVARLSANLSVAADFGWDATTIAATNVSYASTWELYPVSIAGWNSIIQWVVKQMGPRQSLGQLWDRYVVTPATPYITLDNVSTAASEQWFAVSSDVKVLKLPPLLAEGPGGSGAATAAAGSDSGHEGGGGSCGPACSGAAESAAVAAT